MSATLAAGVFGDAVNTTHIIIAAGSNNIIIDVIFLQPNLLQGAANTTGQVNLETTSGSLIVNVQNLIIATTAPAQALTVPSVFPFAKGLVIPR